MEELQTTSNKKEYTPPKLLIIELKPEQVLAQNCSSVLSCPTIEGRPPTCS